LRDENRLVLVLEPEQLGGGRAADTVNSQLGRRLAHER
jgi:hypothetical protein